jgi:hypothetical protein
MSESAGTCDGSSVGRHPVTRVLCANRMMARCVTIQLTCSGQAVDSCRPAFWGIMARGGPAKPPPRPPAIPVGGPKPWPMLPRPPMRPAPARDTMPRPPAPTNMPGAAPRPPAIPPRPASSKPAVLKYEARMLRISAPDPRCNCTARLTPMQTDARRGTCCYMLTDACI